MTNLRILVDSWFGLKFNFKIESVQVNIYI